MKFFVGGRDYGRVIDADDLDAFLETFGKVVTSYEPVDDETVLFHSETHEKIKVADALTTPEDDIWSNSGKYWNGDKYFTKWPIKDW